MAKKTAKRAPKNKPLEPAPEPVPENPAETAHAAVQKLIGHTSIVAQTLLRNQQQAYKDPTIVVAKDLSQFSIGIPLPCFALEYVLQSNILELGFVFQLVGGEGSFKSGFAAEMGRWFIQFNGGMVNWLEHESKLSDDWIPSIVGWDYADRVLLQKCHSIDEWQSSLQFVAKKHKDYWDFGLPNKDGSKRRRGTGPTYPVLMVVDSVLGKSMQETQDTVVREGHAGRAHPVEAKSLTSFLRMFPQLLTSWPMTLMLINQLKMGQDSRGLPVRQKAGGYAKEFQEAIELQLEKRGHITEYQDYSQATLELKCFKNSLGTTGRRSPVIVKWWSERTNPDEDYENSEHIDTRQITVWDWGASTIELLLRMEDTSGSKRKQVVDLTKVANKNAVWSKTLGIPKDDPLPYSEAGKRLHENRAVMRDLREAFEIKRRRVFKPGENYAELFHQRRIKIGEKLEHLKR